MTRRSPCLSCLGETLDKSDCAVTCKRLAAFQQMLDSSPASISAINYASVEYAFLLDDERRHRTTDEEE